MLPKISALALAHGGWSWWVIAYMYTYSMDLFFDFAGYSLFAVGISYIMGIQTPMNFNKPFIAKNIKDFWNRWHMTLSFWFRDYIYMRLVFFMMKKKLLKSRIAIANVGYLTLFLIMGFWHGVTWYYIVYGLYHAVAINLCDMWLRFKKRHKEKIPHNKFTEALAIFITGSDEVRNDLDIDIFETGLLDSMGTVQMLLELQAQCGVDVPVSEFERTEWNTPNKIIAKVESMQ